MSFLDTYIANIVRISNEIVAQKAPLAIDKAYAAFVEARAKRRIEDNEND